MQQVLTDPIVFVITIIMVTTIGFIALAVIGLDKGVVLKSMGGTEFARGLITYLFAITTIGVAIAVILFALTQPGTESGAASKDIRFDRAKDVLSLLLGVFGTIVGFYFGAEATQRGRADAQQLQVSTLDLAPQPVAPTGTLMVRAVVRGGVPPYRFAVGRGEEKPRGREFEFPGEGGWIVKQVQLEAPVPEHGQYIRLIVQDFSGNRAEQGAPVKTTT